MSGLTRLTCEETFRRLDDYIDRALSPHELRSVEEHLEICAQCWKEYEFETTLMTAIRYKVKQFDIPEELRAAIATRLAIAGASMRPAPAP